MVKLLVADDERKICRLLETFFSERGFEVLLAHDGPSALACIKKERPHLVFLDLHMPGLNGVDVLREAQQIDKTMKIIVITAVDDEESIERVKALGAVDYVLKPFSLEYLQEEVLRKVGTSLYEDLRASNDELKKALEEMRQVSLGIVAAFSMVVSKIDPHYTHEHVSRSVEYATQILSRLHKKGVSFGMSDELVLAGILLHDVGKIFTPKEILFKPGPLSKEEWRVMRRHPVEGAEILEQISGLKEMAKIVRYHQESYDGSGYPEGLKGEQIPMGARVATAVDAFDAMLTDRPYRKGMPIEKAIAELKRNRGIQFDPVVVDVIVSLYEEGKLHRVHLPDPSHPLKPGKTRTTTARPGDNTRRAGEAGATAPTAKRVPPASRSRSAGAAGGQARRRPPSGSTRHRRPRRSS